MMKYGVAAMTEARAATGVFYREVVDPLLHRHGFTRNGRRYRAINHLGDARIASLTMRGRVWDAALSLDAKKADAKKAD